MAFSNAWKNFNHSDQRYDHTARSGAGLFEPEEIARAVVFLAADDAGFITGSTLSLNGGQYMV